MSKQEKPQKATSRRKFLTVAAASAGGATIAGAPFIRTAAAATTTWRVQTSWPAGVGLATFKAWCNTIKEKTGGELEFKGYAAKEVVGDFELLDGVRNGVLEAMNSFTLYWAGKIPATAFLSSYLMGLRYPHEWDVFFYSRAGCRRRATSSPSRASIMSAGFITAPTLSTRKSRSARSRISRSSNCGCPAA